MADLTEGIEIKNSAEGGGNINISNVKICNNGDCGKSFTSTGFGNRLYCNDVCKTTNKG